MSVVVLVMVVVAVVVVMGVAMAGQLYQLAIDLVGGSAETAYVRWSRVSR